MSKTPRDAPPRTPESEQRWKEQIEYEKEMFDRARAESTLRYADHNLKRADYRLSHAWLEVFVAHLRNLTGFFLTTQSRRERWPSDLIWVDLLVPDPAATPKSESVERWERDHLSRHSYLWQWKEHADLYLAHCSMLRGEAEARPEWEITKLGGEIDELWAAFNDLQPCVGELMTAGEFVRRARSQLKRAGETTTLVTAEQASCASLYDARSGKRWNGRRDTLLDILKRAQPPVWDHLS